MGLFNIIDPALDFILRPVLSMGHLWFFIIISLFVSFAITVSYKFLTDQKRMKELKDTIKEYQGKIKENKGDHKKAMELQKKAMELNFEYMKHSFKATLYTMIPVIIIFGWVSANAAYMPIMPGDEFSAAVYFKNGFNGNATIEAPEAVELLSDKTIAANDGRALWNMKANEGGRYELIFTANGESFSKNLLITKELRYESISKRKKGLFDWIYGAKEGYLSKESNVFQITLGNKAAKPFGRFSLFGWEPGWIGTYIIFSIVFSTLLRKVMKVY